MTLFQMVSQWQINAFLWLHCKLNRAGKKYKALRKKNTAEFKWTLSSDSNTMCEDYTLKWIFFYKSCWYKWLGEQNGLLSSSLLTQKIQKQLSPTLTYLSLYPLYILYIFLQKPKGEEELQRVIWYSKGDLLKHVLVWSWTGGMFFSPILFFFFISDLYSVLQPWGWNLSIAMTTKYRGLKQNVLYFATNVVMSSLKG